MSTAAAPPTDDHLARGIRSLALKHWSDACDHLAQAVEQAYVHTTELEYSAEKSRTKLNLALTRVGRPSTATSPRKTSSR